MERADKKPRILVLGATGDIGSTLLKRLTQIHYVRALTRRDPSDLIDSFPEVEWVNGDVLDRTSLEGAIKGVDIVFNTVGVMTSKYRNPKAHEVNVQGLLNTVWACEEQGVRRFVHLSSVAVYGKQSKDVEEGKQLVVEDSPQNATGAYGLSKIEGEKIVQTVFNNTDWAIIRPASLIGKEMEIFTGKILTALTTFPVHYLKGAEATFNYIDVNNLVDLMLLAAYLPGAKNQIFNAVDGVNSWENMIRLHAQAVGLKAKGVSLPRGIPKTLLSLPLTESLGARFNVAVELLYSMVSRRIYSAEKAKNVLEWHPRISLDETMADISKHFRQF